MADSCGERVSGFGHVSTGSLFSWVLCLIFGCSEALLRILLFVRVFRFVD